MKKTILQLALGLGVILSTTNAQYYGLAHGNAKMNPGGLNQDNEYPVGGGISAGWSTLLNGAPTSPSWSPVSVLPFAFKLNGVDVTNYKVSTSGVLTFTTDAAVVPAYASISLPSNTIPAKSICYLGITPIGANQSYANIVTKTFGAAPNRQFWVTFSAYNELNLGSSAYFFGSIVLEETTNKIYFVDQRRYPATATKLSFGVQVDSANAWMVDGSPNINSLAGTSSAADDNSYYEFIRGTQSALKAHLTNETDGIVSLTNTSGLPIKVSAFNMGYMDITSAKLNYSVNNKATVTTNLSSLTITKSGGTSILASATNYVPASTEVGSAQTVKAWLTDMNGLGVGSDTATFTFFVNEGTSGTKRVFLEEGSGAWCGFCPDGHRVVRDMEAKPELKGKVTSVIHHNSDGLAQTESNTLNTAYATGYPSAWIDRFKFDDQNTVGTSRNVWEAKVTAKLNDATPVNVSIKNKNYNAATRTLTYDVEAEFVDYGMPGDLRIGSMIVENECRGPYTGATSTTWTQHNYYSKDDNAAGGTTHPLYNEPGYMVGYYHQHAVRAIPSTAWGDAGVITAPTKGSKFTKSYTYQVPTETNVVYQGSVPQTMLNVSELQSTNDGLGINKPTYTYIVAYVSYYNADATKRWVLNVTDDESDENGLFNTGVTEVNNHVNISNVYPNPANNYAVVDFNLNTTNRNVSIEVIDLVGKSVMTVAESASYAAGSHSASFDVTNLKAGVYFVTVKTAEGNSTMKFVVSH